MRRITCLLGSPRAGGNSDQLARTLLEAVRGEGAECRAHALRDLRFQGCINLRDCRTAGDRCGQADDLAPVLEAVQASDVIVFATPIYFCNMAGLLKQAFDRFFGFFVPDYITAQEPSRFGREKVFVLIQTQGERAERYGDLLQQYGPALDKLGLERRHLIRACGVREPGDLTMVPEVLEQARELGRELAR